MGLRSWWHRKTGVGKAIVVLAAIFLIQISLALSTGLILQAYTDITGRVVNIERPILLVIPQLAISIPTLILLIIAIAIRAIISFRGRGPIVSPVPAITLPKNQHDEEQNP